jgi:hemerythrin superfamily protein
MHHHRAQENAMTETSTEHDVVDGLTVDHREATSLIAQIWSTQDPEQRRDLADTLISELVRHSVAEEMYVYPAMKKHLPNGDEAVEHDTEEHKELEQTMKELEAVEPDDARFDELVRKLETTLVDHIDDEEADQFPELRARVPRSELVEMAGKVETAKKLAPTRPHPSAPNAEVFHKLVGPGVGLVDRLRDKLTGRATG